MCSFATLNNFDISNKASLVGGGQYIVVIPAVDLVVVFTGGVYDISTLGVPMLYYDIIQDYILPSLN